MRSHKSFPLSVHLSWMAIVLACTLAPTTQWAMQGHSIIAAIAEKRLKAENPEIFEKLLKMLKGLRAMLPETEDTLLEAAAIPDLLNFQFGGFLLNDHFINKPIVYVKDSESNVNIPNPLEDENVINSLERAVEVIKNALDPTHHQTVKRGFMDSLMLRYLLHLTGDIHQPLHTVAFFAKDLFGGTIRNGDQGGNLIPINDIFHKGQTHLHKIYDDAFNTFDYSSLHYPYSEDLQKTIHSQADYLTSLYPEDYFGSAVKNLDFSQWAEEGYDIAKNFIYSQVELFPVMGPEYVLTAKKICQERMTLAGYRLIRLIKAVFSTKASVESETLQVKTPNASLV